MNDLETLPQLLQAHAWIPAASLLIGAVVRLLKSDTKIPIDIPPRWRPVVALALGLVSGVLDAIAQGTPWKEAIFGGLISGGLAILGHDVVIGTIRGGKEVRVPGLMKDESGSGPPSGGAGKAVGLSAIVFGVMRAAGVFTVVLTLARCSPHQDALSQADAANDIARKAANVVNFIAPLMPDGDAKVVALKAAQAVHDFDKVFTDAKPLLEKLSQEGNDVPPQIAHDLVTGAAAAKGFEQGMRALSGRNPDGSAPKQ